MVVAGWSSAWSSFRIGFALNQTKVMHRVYGAKHQRDNLNLTYNPPPPPPVSL